MHEKVGSEGSEGGEDGGRERGDDGRGGRGECAKLSSSVFLNQRMLARDFRKLFEFAFSTSAYILDSEYDLAKGRGEKDGKDASV